MARGESETRPPWPLLAECLLCRARTSAYGCLALLTLRFTSSPSTDPRCEPVEIRCGQQLWED